MLEERAKLAALTSSSLTEWSSTICSRLGGEVGRTAADRATWQHLISQGDDMRVLDALERTLPALIAFVRAWSDVRRETYEAQQAARDAAAQAAAAGDPLTAAQHDLLYEEDT